MLGCDKLWDFWNYLPLKKFVEKFAADDAEIPLLFEAYKQDLKTYKVTTRLIDCISIAESDYKPEERQHEKSGREYTTKKSQSSLERLLLLTAHWNMLMTFGMKLLASMTYLLMWRYLTPSVRVVF